jgi:hypothetical protein
MLLLRLAPIIFVIAIHWGRSSVPARYEKIENCTTSGKSLRIDRCDIGKDHKLYFEGTILKPIDDVFVSLVN